MRCTGHSRGLVRRTLRANARKAFARVKYAGTDLPWLKDTDQSIQVGALPVTQVTNMKRPNANRDK